MSSEKEEENDPRESIFPNWYDLSIKIHGYETKGAFGTIHVLNSHESQKPTVLKLFKPLRDPSLKDEFICEALDPVNEDDFELVKGILKRKILKYIFLKLSSEESWEKERRWWTTKT